MKFLLTYAAVDGEYGNLFWHSFIILSKLEAGKKIEVLDTWGFYGLPSTERNSYLSKLKIKIRLDVDLTGNHGMLRHEEVRFLDTGKGLHGVTFEITEEKFNALQEKCKNMAANQENAIKEVVESQGIKGKSDNKFRIYPYEDYSRTIYDLEKIKAEQANRETRLKPFELNLNITPHGPTFRQAHTCKSQIILLLQGILSEQQINRLTEHGKHPTIPKYSGPMENIYLHSSGPLREHKKSSGETVYYRDITDPAVKLHWTFPPQEIEAMDPSTENLLKLSTEYCKDAQKVVRKLQRLYWLFTNAVVPEQYKEYKKNLIDLIKEHYEAFSIVASPKESTAVKGWKAYAFSLFSLPRNEDEEVLLNNIRRGKCLMNDLYMAMADDWKIDDDSSSSLEALASYLTPDDKKSLCKIIGRTYVEPDLEYQAGSVSYVNS